MWVVTDLIIIIIYLFFVAVNHFKKRVNQYKEKSLICIKVLTYPAEKQ